MKISATVPPFGGSKADMFDPYLESFERAAAAIAQDSAFSCSWRCKTGFWPDPAAPQAAFLKLLKPAWSQDAEGGTQSTAGLFFSVWVDDEALKKGGLHYNLHALKLRQLEGYALESRKFALAFRAAFGARSSGWPGVTMAYGPQTLFQGFFKCRPARMEAAAVALAKKFLPVSTIVDDLLASAVLKRLKPRALSATMVV